MLGRNQHNIVKQLSFNKKISKFLKKFKEQKKEQVILQHLSL